MEENVLEQNNFSKEEKDILEKLQLVDLSVAKHIQESNRKLLETRYYDKFEINCRRGLKEDLTNVFITIEQDEKGKISYHFRWINEKKSVIEERIVVEDGKVFTIPEMEEFFKDVEIDVEDLIEEYDRDEEKKTNLKGIIKREYPEEEKKKSKKDEEVNEKDEQEESKDEETMKMEEDLAEQGLDIDIGKHREIKDNKLPEMMPSTFEKGKKYELAEDNKTGQYMILAKQPNEKYNINNNLEAGKMIHKKMYVVQPDGSMKEGERTEQVMYNPNNPEEGIVIPKQKFLEEPRINIVKLTPCNKMIARSVQMEDEGIEKQEEKDVTNTFNEEGVYFDDEIAHIKQFLEEMCGIDEVTIEQLKGIQEMGLDVFLQEEARKAGMHDDVDGFIKAYLKPAEGISLKDKLENAQEDAFNDTKGANKKTIPK